MAIHVASFILDFLGGFFFVICGYSEQQILGHNIQYSCYVKVIEGPALVIPGFYQHIFVPRFFRPG